MNAWSSKAVLTDKTQRSRLKMMYKAGQIGFSEYRTGVNDYKHPWSQRGSSSCKTERVTTFHSKIIKLNTFMVMSSALFLYLFLFFLDNVCISYLCLVSPLKHFRHKKNDKLNNPPCLPSSQPLVYFACTCSVTDVSLKHAEKHQPRCTRNIVGWPEWPDCHWQPAWIVCPNLASLYHSGVFFSRIISGAVMFDSTIKERNSK